MASGENQGLQIALISFVMVALISAVLAFLFWRNYSEQVVKNEALTKDLTEQRAAATQAQDELNKQREQYIGVSPDDAGKIEQIHADDMKRFAATLPGDMQTYRDALNNLLTAYQQVQETLTKTNEDLKALQAAYNHAEAQKQSQVAAIDAQRVTDKDNYSKELADIKTYREERAQIETGLRADLVKAQEETKTQTDELKGQVSAQVAVNQTLDTANKDLTTRIQELTTSSFQTPHGHVVRAGEGVVWIDLGWDDLLRKQVKFSVHDAEANTVEGQGKKGTIEVIDLIDGHLATARIVEDDFRNPIVPGDQIYTPLWEPGRGQHFAVIGEVDLDGDGNDDSAALRNLIEMNGGVIDTQLKSSGELLQSPDSEGINVNTSYLILGKSGSNSAFARSRDALVKQAQQFGVEQISTDKFLDLIGFRDPQHVLRFGLGGNAATFREEAPDGGHPSIHTPEELKFRKRRPPTQQKIDAF